MYTEDFGRVSYLTSGAHGKRAKVARALLLPLSILDLEVEHLNNREIQRIKEAKSDCPVTQLQCHPVKNAIALFLSETLYRVIQERECNPSLFNYLYRSIKWLEIADDGIANFHLTFLFQLAFYMGIRPDGKAYKSGCFFDLLNGVFTDNLPAHKHYLDREESLVFGRLMRINYENMAVYSFTGQERTRIIRRIIQYFRLHLSDFPEIKSLSVMQSLFND
jgi:DNA repair protein RecO (recombination protein O)